MLNFDWLADVSQESAKTVFFILFAIIALIVSFISNDYVFLGLPPEERKWWKNLKLWALAVLASLAFVYYKF